MRITLGRGKRRQEWEVCPKDDRSAVNALLEYVGLRK